MMRDEIVRGGICECDADVDEKGARCPVFSFDGGACSSSFSSAWAYLIRDPGASIPMRRLLLAPL